MPLDERDHLIIKLIEECDEASQRACKLLQFGPDDVEKGQSLSNAERLRLEVNDVLAHIAMAEEAGALPTVTPAALADHIAMKRAKVLRYRELSESLGRVVGTPATHSLTPSEIISAEIGRQAGADGVDG